MLLNEEISDARRMLDEVAPLILSCSRKRLHCSPHVEWLVDALQELQQAAQDLPGRWFVRFDRPLALARASLVDVAAVEAQELALVPERAGKECPLVHVPDELTGRIELALAVTLRTALEVLDTTEKHDHEAEEALRVLDKAWGRGRQALALSGGLHS